MGPGPAHPADSDQGSPFSLTERALREGFERRFAFRVFANQCRFAGDAEVRVTLRKNPVEGLLVTDQAYDAWRPQAEADEDTPGNTLEVSVVLQK